MFFAIIEHLIRGVLRNRGRGAGLDKRECDISWIHFINRKIKGDTKIITDTGPLAPRV